MSRFVERASQIMEAAESALACGESCSDMTILIGPGGGLHIFTDSDWPMDSLAQHHGARAAYRVSEHRGSVRIQGREGSRTCVMESISSAETARRMLNAAPLSRGSLGPCD